MTEKDKIEALEQKIIELEKTIEIQKKNQERMELALKGADIGSWVHDSHQYKIILDDRAVEILGFYPESDDDWSNHVHPDDLKRIQSIDDAMLEGAYTDSSYEYEYRIVNESGETRWIQDRGRNVEVDEEGKSLRQAGTIQDITEQKKVEEALRKSYEQIELALIGGNLGMWNWDLDQDKFSIDDRAMKILDLDLSNGKEFDDYIHPDDLLKVQAYEDVVRKGTSEITGGDYRIITSSGETKWIYSQGKVVDFSEDKRPLRAAGTVQDITERKLAEEELRKNQEYLELAVNGVGLGSWVYDVAGDRYFTDALTDKILGGHPKSDAGWDKYIHPDDLKRIRAIYNDTVLEGKFVNDTFDYEYRIITGSGEIKWIYERIKNQKIGADGKPLQQVGVVLDITEKKKSEEALKESRDRMALALFGGDLGMWDVDIPTGKLTMDDRAIEIMGADPSDSIVWDMLVFKDDVEASKRAWRDFIGNKVPFQNFEYRINTKSGNIKWILDRGRIVKRDENGNPLRASGTIQDITERKLAEIENNRLRKLLQNITDSMPSALVSVDAEGKVMRWNIEAERVSGISPEKAFGRKFDEVLPHMAREIDNVKKAIRDRVSIRDEKVLTEINGEVRFSDVTVYPLVTNGLEGAVIRIDDVTERVRIEEMMIQSEKMMSIGGLAAGMAHEINNPLAAILQNIQVITNRISGDLPKNRIVAEECNTTMDDLKAYMDKREILPMIDAVMNAGKRAAKIVENMLSFSRKTESLKEPHRLSALMDITVELAENEYDLKKKFDFRQTKIIREYDPDLPPVICEGGQIQQVFLNILINAAQAMADSTENPQFVLRLMQDEGVARIEIEDNGPGMPEEVRKRIFEPFFTTKAVGVGTGLGLSVSYFIITENHYGTMAVESALGQGTKFIICLPFE